MTDEKPTETGGRVTSVTDLKQACLDLAKESMAFFDVMEVAGDEAPWTAPGASALLNMNTAFETLRVHFLTMAERRMRALTGRGGGS